MTLDSQDMINTLVNQRNAAMDEIVRMSAIIKALERKLKVLEAEITDSKVT
jgi:hypothetical protein